MAEGHGTMGQQTPAVPDHTIRRIRTKERLQMHRIPNQQNTMTMEVNENTSLGSDSYEEASAAKKDAAVPVIKTVQAVDSGINKVVIIAKLSRFDALKHAKKHEA